MSVEISEHEKLIQFAIRALRDTAAAIEDGLYEPIKLEWRYDYGLSRSLLIELKEVELASPRTQES